MVVIAAPKQSKVAQLKKLTASNVSAWIPTEGGKPPPRAPALGLAVLKTTKGMATVTTTTTTAAVHTMVVIAAPKQSKVAQLKKLTASNVSAWIPTEGGKPPPRAPALGLAVLKTTKGMATVTTTTTTAAV